MAFSATRVDGVLRNFDLGKVPLCLFVRGKLGRASRTRLSDVLSYVYTLVPVRRMLFSFSQCGTVCSACSPTECLPCTSVLPRKDVF